MRLSDAVAGLMSRADAVLAGEAKGLPVGMSATYEFEAFDRFGELKWRETVPNIVVNVGLDDLLNKYFLGSSYSASFFVGLKGSGTVAAGDTMASHAGWSELSTYSGTARATAVLASARSQTVHNSDNKASFSISASASVAGAFLTTDVSTGGSAGILYGAADFASVRTVESGDTLNVTVTLTAAAA